jgi:hypothetical protein
MKPSWLVPVLAGGGAAASLDKVGIISDKIAEVKVLLKGKSTFMSTRFEL